MFIFYLQMNFKILIIHANDKVYNLYSKKFIKLSSAEFFQKKEAAEALKFLNESSHQIDLIITDFSAINGYDFVNIIKSNEKNKNIPIIAITHFPEQNYSQEVFAKVISIMNVEKTLHGHVLDILKIKN